MLVLLFLVVVGATPALTDFENTCPGLCVCTTGEDKILERRVKSATCSGYPSSDLPVISNLSSAIEVLRYYNTSVRRVDFFEFRPFTGLLAINFTGVGINEVIGRGKYLQKLTVLELGENNIHILVENNFRDFPNLTKLNLAGNGLHTISRSALLLPQLKVLDLRRNRLADLKSHYFSDLVNLQDIYLSNNVLSVVSDFVFTHNLRTLDLSHNHIVRIEDSAFEGINVSGTLHLGHNTLRRLPNTALKRLGFVRRLVLDGNSFHAFGPKSVVGLSVASLSISYHRNLHRVHYEAFTNLLDLEELEIRGNPDLNYIHPQSLVNVPKLRSLDLSNNALLTLEEDLIKSAPSITEISIANNKFACHCSLSWLKKLTKEEIYCSTKMSTGVITLDQVSNLSDKCPPFIVPLFPTSCNETIGNNVSFHCLVLGSADLKVHWRTSKNEKLFNKCEGRLCVKDNTLTIQYLHQEDSGLYTCMARDAQGNDSRTVTLQVRDVNIRVFPLTITSTFITLSWNLSNSISNSYMLRYEETPTGDENDPKAVPSNQRSVTFSVGPKMHSYTVHGLRPGVKYSFYLCIQREEYTIVISSTTVTTREEDFLLTLGIERSYLSVILMSVFIGIILATCISFCGIKCWRQRIKLQQQSSQMAKSESGMSGCPILQSSSTHSDMAFITYINLTDDVLFADQSTESTLMHGYA